VKSTPMRGMKETLKPDAYKQWEPAHPCRARMTENGGRKAAAPAAPFSVFCPPYSVLCTGEPVTAYLLYNGSAT
jgi:hypothetical protein